MIAWVRDVEVEGTCELTDGRESELCVQGGLCVCRVVM